MKTLLVVAPYFPPHRGGLERYAYEVAQRQNRAPGWRVVVLTTSDTRTDIVEEYEGLIVHRLGYRIKLSNTPFSFLWFIKIRRILLSIAPDCIHIHTPVPGIGDVASLVAPRTIPQVLTYHGASMRKGSMLVDMLIVLYETLLMPCMVRRARHIACSSDFVRTTFLRRYMHKSTTVPPGVDGDFFTPTTLEVHEPKLLMVGGLGHGESHKGLARMIALLPALRERVPELSLEVVGDGTMRSDFEKQVAALGLSSCVTFSGTQDTDGMREAYRRASVFVLPTTNDSFPTVILEAMASGLPVVSTRVGSIDAMVVDGSTGYLVAPMDTDALRDRLAELLTNAPLRERMGAAGRERVSSRFGWGQVASHYGEMYGNAVTPERTVAHVVAYYPPHVGGMEVVAERLARDSADHGYSVEVFTSTQGRESAPLIERDTRYRVHRLRSIEFAHTPILWTLPFRLLMLPRDTLIHLHIAQAVLPEITMLIAWVRGFRVVAHFHLDVEPSGPLGWLFVLYKRYVLPRTLRAADAVLIASKEQADFVVRTHGVEACRIHIITNGVDASFFKKREAYSPHIPLRILTVSRLTIQKRVDRLIAALPHVDVPVELIVVGDGEDRAKLEEQAQEQYPGGVQFVGKKDRSEIQSYHAWADVFVIPSDKEGGMPLTVLEAMAAGLPIVAADAPGVTDLVSGVGLVVQNPSPGTIASAISSLAHDESMLNTLSTQSAVCASSHTWEEALMSVYRAYDAVGDRAVGA